MKERLGEERQQKQRSECDELGSGLSRLMAMMLFSCCSRCSLTDGGARSRSAAVWSRSRESRERAGEGKGGTRCFKFLDSHRRGRQVPLYLQNPDRGVLGAGTLRLYLYLFLRPREASDVLRLFVPCVFCASTILVFLLKHSQIIKYTAGTDADSTARNILLHYCHMPVHEFGTGPRCSARQKLRQLLSRPADASATSKTHGVGGCCA